MGDTTAELQPVERTDKAQVERAIHLLTLVIEDEDAPGSLRRGADRARDELLNALIDHATGVLANESVVAA